LVLLAYLAVWCWNRRKQRERLDFIEFTDRPRILILYSDDCIQHRQAVIALADYLYHAANCEVYIDELELRRQPTVLPSDWLIRRANDADYYLMLFTEGSTIYFKQPRRHFLLSDRPWDELFGLGMKFVLGRLLRDTHSQSTAPVSILAQQRRYICIQLPYSPAASIPDFLLTLQCPCFNLPDDLLALVCFLHHLDLAAVAPSVPLHADGVIQALSTAATFIDQKS